LKTFLDSGVLISAWKRGEFHERAMSILADETREFLTCENVKLEAMPKPTFEKRRAEVEFYANYFNEAADSEPFSAALGEAALELGKKFGLAAGDALNLASAIRQGAEEFITSELPGKPMFRVKELKVISLHSL
jgi:predicted nucleic acid-binding protein